ncbi:MAG: hypothetical protein VX248_13245 [Pseudomonadota bacterium]|nr:hypothetical protein [Pseudomonadota bacterium]
MTEIEEFERRINAALDRIAYQVETFGDSSPVTAPAGNDSSEDIEKLKSDLADERLANEQLEERVKAIRDRQESQVSELQAQVAGFKASISDLDAELQRLRHANDQLTANNAELREALEKNVSEPHLINRAMLAELEGLRAARSADRAETQTLIDTLEPLLAAAAQEESA